MVEAAAGGVGTLLVQLARALGARVVGAARGGRKLDVVRELGAGAAVDYSEPGWTDRVLEATGGVGPDVVFDGVGGRIGRAAFEVTVRGGHFSPVIGQTFPLERAADAHAAVENRTAVGKTLLLL